MGESRYEIYPTRSLLGKRRYRWRFRHANGQIMASGEAYSRKIDCEQCVRTLRDSRNAPIRYMA